MSDKMTFTARELIAMAVAVDRYVGGYVKRHETDREHPIRHMTNFSYLMGVAKKQPNAKDIEVFDEDYTTADEIIEYFEGLIFKAMERNLSEYEEKITEIIRADDLNVKGGDNRIPIIPSLPNVFRNNQKHDVWSDEERSLRKVSDYVGTLKTRGDFVGTVKHVREMRRTNSLLVAILTEDNNIIKFFYDLFRDNTIRDTLKVGNTVTFSGYVKAHDVSKFSKCKETFLNRVSIDKEDK